MLVQGITDTTGDEVTADTIREVFYGEYINRKDGFELLDSRIETRTDAEGEGGTARLSARVRQKESVLEIKGEGNGPIDAFCNALRQSVGVKFSLSSYHEHALEEGSDSRAVSYIEVEDRDTGRRRFGVGIDTSISQASFRAVLSALNRLKA